MKHFKTVRKISSLNLLALMTFSYTLTTAHVQKAKAEEGFYAVAAAVEKAAKEKKEAAKEKKEAEKKQKEEAQANAQVANQAEQQPAAGDKKYPIKKDKIKVASATERFCDEPKSQLYKKQDNFDKVDVDLITDYDTLNTSGFSEALEGVVRIKNKETGLTEIYPVLLSQRGNSRRDYCSARPFRMQFIKLEIKQQIEASLVNVQQNSSEYLNSYYKQFLKLSVDKTNSVDSLTEGIFKGLGDDIKVVTHCGQSGWEMVGGNSEDQQNSRLLSEYTIYKVLEPLKMPIEQTRLASISYYKADGTPAYTNDEGKLATRLAFFREPPKSVAHRCGIFSKEKDGLEIKKSGSEDTISHYQTDFVNKFVFNNDYGIYGHNMNTFFDIKGNSVFGAYDFDLSGIILKNYFKNASTLEENLNQLKSLIQSGDTQTAISTIERFMAAESQMKLAVQTAQISEDMRTQFNKWLDLYMDELKKQLGELKNN